jgi:hypothetical protein
MAHVPFDQARDCHATGCCWQEQQQCYEEGIYVLANECALKESHIQTAELFCTFWHLHLIMVLSDGNRSR